MDLDIPGRVWSRVECGTEGLEAQSWPAMVSALTEAYGRFCLLSMERGGGMSIREGLLKAEFADWYPGLRPGVWYPAAQLADIVLKQLRDGAPRWKPEGRVPSDAHFQFRGGDIQVRQRQRSRRLDAGG